MKATRRGKLPVVATRTIGETGFAIVPPLPLSLSHEDLLQALDDPDWTDAAHVYGWLQDRLFEITTRHYDVGPGPSRSEQPGRLPVYVALQITERPD